MLAMILAGDSGTRLDLGEKPLVTIGGQPTIAYVIDAFSEGGFDVIVVLPDKTPYTRNWCRAMGIAHLTASGEGYIEDIAEAVALLEEQGPFFTCVADLPCLRPYNYPRDRNRHDFALSDGRRFRLNVWDFGGQEIYHATHQFFLTHRSLYLLVDDTRNHTAVAPKATAVS